MISAVRRYFSINSPKFRLQPRPFPSHGLSASKVSVRRLRHVNISNKLNSMAGTVRQPINIPSLSSYLEKNVADIKLPIGLKQVLPHHLQREASLIDVCLSLASVNPILPTSSAQPMEKSMYYERSLPASCSPRPHIKCIESSASFTL